MALSLPGVSSGSSRIYAGHYPLKRSTTFSTGILQYQNGSQQRWMNRGALGGFTLEYDDLSFADMMTLRNFVALVGAGDQQWQFQVDLGASQQHQFLFCRFLDDHFTFTETRQGAFNATIRFQQHGTAGIPVVGYTPALIYPTINPAGPANNNGTLVTGFPFTITDNYLIDKHDTDTGARTAYNWMTQGFYNVPSRALRSWELSLTTIDNTGLAWIEDHFVRAGGGYRTFAWTQPETSNAGKLYTSVRYDMDSLDITHYAYNLNSVTLKLAEVYGKDWSP